MKSKHSGKRYALSPPRLSRSFNGALVLALTAALFFAGQPAANAQSDFDPPVASQGSATPSSIDVSSGPATVTVRARITDATGVQGGYFYSNSPSYGTNYQRQQQNATRVSGTPQDGIWEATFTYDNTWEPGTWSVDLSISDTNGNQANPRGIAYITVVNRNSPDFDPPVASQGSATPSSIDVSSGPATVTVRARITDATGVQGGYFYSNSPSYGTNYQRQQQNATRVSGTPQDGIWEATFTYDNTWEPGTWSVDLSISDTNGNQANPRGIAYITVRTGASTVPAAPTQVSAVGGDKSAVVSWSKPGTNGAPITGYTVTTTPGGITKAVAADVTTATITGLTNGTAYSFTVTATNAIGNSPASAPSNSVTPVGAPDRPGAPTATPGDQSATVSWSSPGTNGAPITGYIVTATPGSITKAVSADVTTTTFTGLTNGTAYTFTVTATNAAGTSPASSASNPVTPQSGVAEPPGAVTSLQTKPVRRGVIVSWQAPSGPNGTDVLTYEYRTANTISWTRVDGQSIRLRGVKGQRVVVFVRAVNEAGPGRATRVVSRIG